MQPVRRLVVDPSIFEFGRFAQQPQAVPWSPSRKASSPCIILRASGKTACSGLNPMLRSVGIVLVMWLNASISLRACLVRPSAEQPMLRECLRGVTGFLLGRHPIVNMNSVRAGDTPPREGTMQIQPGRSRKQRMTSSSLKPYSHCMPLSANCWE